MGFFNFYAYEFDYEKYGISNVGEGNFFKKSDCRGIKFTRQLVVVNFLEPTSNIAKPVLKYFKVINLFEDLLFNIIFLKTLNIQKGILSDILNKIKRATYY